MTAMLPLKVGEPNSGHGDSLREAARKINLNLAALNSGKAEADHEHPEYAPVDHEHPEFTELLQQVQQLTDRVRHLENHLEQPMQQPKGA